MPLTLFRALFLAVGMCVAARATTVIPPTFDELVGSSELIFRGKVVAIDAAWTGEGPRRRIATRVTFAVERTIRGKAGDSLVLEFLGGAVGGREFVLSGWPTFVVGDRGMFFVENCGGRVCPLVRLRHGRYRIVTGPDSPTERIVRDDFTALPAASDVATPLNETADPRRGAATSTSISLAEFETQIATRSAALLQLQTSQR